MRIFLRYRLNKAARQHFGWQKLRDSQLEAMKALMKGRDAMVVLPTGGGKSAIYQVPVMLKKGPAIVISPLLALQQDQIANLNDRGLKAVRISSAETPKQQEQALRDLASGAARYLFITPEQLARPDRIAALKLLKPCLVAVDEAHCLSHWGHDFRPDYLALGEAIRSLGRPPIVALTATASPPVRDDIALKLGMRKPFLQLSGLDRKNIFVEIGHCISAEVRFKRLQALLNAEEGQGIIYVPTRRAAEELAHKLGARYYHGGMATGPRERCHNEFLSGKIRVMVATSAFGMGIDKADIRWVAHMALPDSPDSYLQEIGRAGRDGLPSRALLLWSAEDMALQRFFAGGKPDVGELAKVAEVLRDIPKSDWHTGNTSKKLARLAGLLEDIDLAKMTAQQAAQMAMGIFGRRQATQLTRIEMMRAFAEAQGCRNKMLLGYFGEHLPGTCGHCDNCVSGAPMLAVDDNPFPVHSTVRHAEWGAGTVLSYDADRMTVHFEQVGYKTLSVSVVQANQLLAMV
jgi:ATP-dependent DNA helicase RecQ